jgi:redox-regulated HSP33 family molecular chaperone
MGDGPLGKVMCIATKDGWVKGFVENPLCDLPPKSNNKVTSMFSIYSGFSF